jgi:hypothetical protein
MILFLISLLLFSPNLEVDLLKIAGNTKAEVEKELGKPTKVELFKPISEAECLCEKVYYLDGNLSIVYYQGKADWIRVSSNIKLLNLNTVKIKAYHNWIDYVIIQVLTLNESHCCNLNG